MNSPLSIFSILKGFFPGTDLPEVYLYFLTTFQNLKVKAKEHSHVFKHEMHADLLEVNNSVTFRIGTGI